MPDPLAATRALQASTRIAHRLQGQCETNCAFARSDGTFGAVHPSCLLYSRIYLRREPLGLELVAAAIRQAGHEVQLIDLQAETERDYFRIVNQWQPDVIAFSRNYLANIPEIIDLAKGTRATLPAALIFVGGHSASFTAEQILSHREGAIDCVLNGEGEPGVIALLDAARHDRYSLHLVPSVTTLDRQGPAPDAAGGCSGRQIDDRPSSLSATRMGAGV